MNQAVTPRRVPSRQHDDDFHPMAEMRKTALEVQYEQARMKPRNINKCIDNALAISTQSEEIAEAAMYSLPERKGGDEKKKKIQGPSVRLAEIVASQWGNIMIETHVIMVGEKEIVAEARGIDFETGNCVSQEVRRRITNRKGHRYSDDMITVTGNAACAIAYRNCVFKLIPGALIAPIYSAVKAKAVGDANKLNERRQKVVKRLQDNLGISLARILAAVDVKKEEDIDAGALETLIGLGTAVNDGDIDKNEAFPAAGSQGSQTSALNQALEGDAPPAPAAAKKQPPKKSPPKKAAQAEPRGEPESPEAEDGVPQAMDGPSAGEEDPDDPFVICRKAAERLAEKAKISVDEAKQRIVSYIPKKFPGEAIDTIDMQQAHAIGSDVKVVVDPETIK